MKLALKIYGIKRFSKLGLATLKLGHKFWVISNLLANRLEDDKGLQALSVLR